MATASRKIQSQVDELLTVQELRLGFGEVTAVTIHTWRHREGLPTIVIRGLERPSIRFYLPDVQRWAKETGRELNLAAMKRKAARVSQRALKGQTHGRSGTASPTQKAA